MKRLLFILKLFLYYIIGLVLFTILVNVTEMIMVELLGAHITFIKAYIWNFRLCLLPYTGIYFVFLVSVYIYNIISVKKLNKKLQKVKERGR